MYRHRQGLVAALFLLPYILVFGIFRFGPSIAGIVISFTKWNIVGTPRFAGLANYRRLFHDPAFLTAFGNTMLFLLYTVPVLLVGGLLIAVLLNRRLHLRSAVRTIAIIPYILIPAVVGIIWNWLYDTNFGILNYYLKALGARPVEWLTSEKWALLSVSIVTIWSYVGYNLVLFLAGLQGISTELYEAAEIDGARRLQVFFRITIPLLAPITSMVLTMTLINTIQIFDQIFVMTNGGPGSATLTLIQYLYGTAFQNFNMGYGSTISCAVLVILVAVVALQTRLFREKA
jgi:multiple sugar transport system permease protein